MKAIFAVAFLTMAATPGVADPLDDGRAICESKRLPPAANGQHGPWDGTWAHCETVVDAWERREAARRDADESTNPDLKKTRDLLKNLQSYQ